MFLHRCISIFNSLRRDALKLLQLGPLMAVFLLTACNENLRSYQTNSEMDESVQVALIPELKRLLFGDPEEDQILVDDETEAPGELDDLSFSDQQTEQQLRLPFDTKPRDSGKVQIKPQPKKVTLDPKSQKEILKRYKHLDPEKLIARKVLHEAIFFFDVNRQRFPNRNVMTIIDYSLPSSHKRLYLVNLRSGKVWNTYVAHGSGSDRNHDGMADLFSNKPDTNTTSLGAFLTMHPYNGSNGYSLKLKGLSNSNSKAYERAIVIHGAKYVRDEPVKQGRSWGCPAVAGRYNTKLINTIKSGSLVYAGVSLPKLHKYQ